MTIPFANTSSELIAVASDALIRGGYRRIENRFAEWDTPTSRLFEDKYNIVAVAVFNTCAELLQSWPDLQGSLVDLISRHVGNAESKSWDGYLVLLTPAVAPSEFVQIEEIRYDISRVRKLVATGDDLKSPGEAERVLKPLLPLTEENIHPAPASVLDLLPDLLGRAGIPKDMTEVVIKAFRDQAGIMERLHEHRQKNETGRT